MSEPARGNPIRELLDHMAAAGVRHPVEQLAVDADVSAPTVFNWVRQGYVVKLDDGIAVARVAAQYGLPIPIERLAKPSAAASLDAPPTGPGGTGRTPRRRATLSRQGASR